MLQFYDSRRRTKAPFEPREPGKVSFYACGPTVYDVPHLGHARSALTYDLLRRYLTWRGFEVTAVANITDIDDNIIGRAQREGRTEPEVAAEYEALYIEQMDRLEILHPHQRPHATEYIDGMVEIIGELIDAGKAYVIEGQGVYFDAATPSSYGQLVDRDHAELLEGAGARVEVDEQKRSPLDFALWKAAKPGEPAWDTPWGSGRPGWHTECVVMSRSLLGEDFDIHGGGDDLVFPHHENELAQSEALDRPFARFWIHNAMVNVSGEKMSKSLGNFTNLREALDHIDPRSLRLLVLQTHYRKTMEMGGDAIEQAGEAIKRLDAFHRRMTRAGVELNGSQRNQDARNRFRTLMDDDLGTPGGLDVVFSMVRTANSALDAEDFETATRDAATAVELADALGLRLGPPPDAEADRDADIDFQIAARNQARADRDFGEADRIRDALASRGIILEDGPDGTTWHRT